MDLFGLHRVILYLFIISFTTEVSSNHESFLRRGIARQSAAREARRARRRIAHQRSWAPDDERDSQGRRQVPGPPVVIERDPPRRGSPESRGGRGIEGDVRVIEVGRAGVSIGGRPGGIPAGRDDDGRKEKKERKGRKKKQPGRLDRRTLALVFKLSNASSAFAVRLFSNMHATLDKDAVFSPHSVHTALTMTSIGAKGRTQREMGKTLGLRKVKLRRQREHRAYQALLTSLAFTHRDVHVHSANAVYVKPNIPLEAAFREQLLNMYQARLDFIPATHPEREINTWVSNVTQGHIPHLLGPRDITQKTAMVLLNAIYLNASWASPFPTRLTQQGVFNTAGGGNKTVDMMQNTHVYKYGRHGNAEVVEVPYKGERLAMFIILPNVNSSVQEVMEALLADSSSKRNPLEPYTTAVNPTILKLYLPKFKVETDVMDIKKTLIEMGIKKAFHRRRADFSGISPTKLHIDGVMHKATLEVREEGTTASAATAVRFNFRSGQMPHTDELRVDRPFVFFIKDKVMNAVLFFGAYVGHS